MYTLVIAVTVVSHLKLFSIPLGDVRSVAGWSQTYTFKSDCERAGEAINKKFAKIDTIVETECLLTR